MIEDKNKMVHLESFNKSYKKFYTSYYDYLKEFYEKEGYIPEGYSQKDMKWLNDNLHDDKNGDILTGFLNYIHIEVVEKLMKGTK